MGRGWGQVGVVRPGLQASPCEPAPHFQDLFFHYVFNNFLHTQVEVCVSTMLSVGLGPHLIGCCREPGSTRLLKVEPGRMSTSHGS